ncbi:protein HEAT INTOLERANT 4 [Mercurialis annua]|uniref:protein HEAT INTOLERANT 4 n=1 Tax=Mercurialis annua TaxID=3986 RepID=UPI002160B464|nr:protein HEAT INTOLERANT 4 [Mercurialis annua]
MRKGAKRKRTQKDDATNVEDKAEAAAAATTAQQNHKKQQKPTKKATAVSTRAKRVKVAKPQSEPEYFEDQRNLEDLWKTAFPVGTEWDQLQKIYEYNWDFSNLESAFEEGGILHGKRVYLFVNTEPQLVPFKGEAKVTIIPTAVAVVSPFPPSDKIGINSVQREAEEIVPMKQMKMDWVPYIPLENRGSQVDRLKSEIFIMACTQRKSALRHLKIERLKKFEYCLPYYYNPYKEDMFEQSTVVSILYDIEPKPVVCEFDWDFDDIEDFTNELIQAEELSEDQKDGFKEFVKNKVKEAKTANREAREARKKAIQEMSEEVKRVHENMRFYKFYPVQTADTPDVSNVKAPFINRYYGKAHEVL